MLYTRSHCISCGLCLTAANGGAVLSNPTGGIFVARDVVPPLELWKVCPSLALRIAGREAGVAEIMSEVLKDRHFFSKSGGGLTLSGGEPLLQIDFAVSLLEAALAEEIDIAIESCLAVDQVLVERVANLPLRWLADLKHTDSQAFRAGTGGDAAVILGNLEYLASRGADLTIRVPIVPGFNDDYDSMLGILRFAAALPLPANESRRRVDLLPYHDLAAGKYAGLGRSYAFAPGTKVESAHLKDYEELGLSLGLAISIGG